MALTLADILQQTRTYSSADDPQLQAILATLRQYDPNARAYSGAGAGGGTEGGGTPVYGAEYDVSKLPKTVRGQDIGQIMWVPPEGGKYESGGFLRDPSLVYDDPTYGRVTPAENYGWKPKPNLWEKLAPLAVGAAAGAGGLGLLDSAFFGTESALGSGGLGWTSGFDLAGGGDIPGSSLLGSSGGSGWTSGYDLAGGGDLTGGSGWTSGYDLPGGGDLAGGGAGGSGWTSGYDLPGGGDLAGGSGLLGKVGDAARLLGRGLNASGLLNRDAGGGGGGTSSSSVRGGGFAGNASPIPGAMTAEEQLAALKRKQGLAHFLNFDKRA